MQPACNQLVNYLSELAEKNYSYSTINAYKAAITQTLSVSGNFSFHNNQLMVRFMRGVFFNNRPKLKYTSTWDVGELFKISVPFGKFGFEESYIEIGISNSFDHSSKSSDIDINEHK